MFWEDFGNGRDVTDLLISGRLPTIQRFVATCKELSEHLCPQCGVCKIVKARRWTPVEQPITASLLEHTKKPNYAVLNGISPHTTVADEAAKAITVQFKFAVSPYTGGRSSRVQPLIGDGTAREFEPEGRAAQEVTELFFGHVNVVGLSARKREAA